MYMPIYILGDNYIRSLIILLLLIFSQRYFYSLIDVLLLNTAQQPKIAFQFNIFRVLIVNRK